MHDVSLVAVIDCGKNLLHDLSGLLFGETALIANFFKELSTSAKLRNNEEGSLFLIEFKDLDDVGMILVGSSENVPAFREFRLHSLICLAPPCWSVICELS